MPSLLLDLPDESRRWSYLHVATGALLIAASIFLPLYVETAAQALLAITQAAPLAKLAILGMLAVIPAYFIIGKASLQYAWDWLVGQRPAKDPQGIVLERHPDWNAHVLDQFATRIETLAHLHREDDTETPP